jgi:hypothetical protein
LIDADLETLVTEQLFVSGVAHFFT